MLKKLSFIVGAQFYPVEHKTKKIHVNHWMTKWPHWNLLDVVSVKVSRTLLIVWNVMKLREKDPGHRRCLSWNVKLLIHAAKCHSETQGEHSCLGAFSGLFLCLSCSEGEEVFLHDNINDISYTLKYEADLLFTRWDRCVFVWML